MSCSSTTLQMGSIATREVVSADTVSTYLDAFAPHSEHDFRQYSRLSLRNKSYTQEAAVILQQFLSIHVVHPMDELDLADIIAGRPEAEALEVLSAICAGLEVVQQRVKILNLSDNALGEKGLRACFPLLQKQEALTEIYFCNNGMSSRASEVIADEILLFRGPEVPTALRVFQFYNNMSGDGGAHALSRVIRNSPHLTQLRFSATRAGRPGSLAVAKSCAELKHLEILDLSDNTFGVEGGLALVTVLKQNMATLMELNLRDTALTDEGAISVLQNLPSSLKTLDLSGNELTYKALETLVQVGLPPQLEILKLEENEFGSVGAKLLSKIPSWPQSLLELGLNSNEFYTSGGLAIIDAILTGCPSCTTLHLDGNFFSIEGMKKMQQQCEEANRGALWVELEDNMEEDEEEDDVSDALIQQFEHSLTI